MAEFMYINEPTVAKNAVCYIYVRVPEKNVHDN